MLKGYFGDFGGQFVPELLIPPLQELEAAMERFLSDTDFKRELNHLFANYVGRPTPLYYCPQVSIFWGDVIKNLLLLQSTSPTPSNSILLKTDKASYSPGEPIKVNFSGFPGNKQDWISIAYPYYQPNQSLQWQYTQGRTQGTISFKGLPAGDYEVRAYLN